MRFLLDHDVPEDLTYLLQELGHEVLRLRDVLQQEADDLVVFQFAQEHGCLLVTCNRDDFIDLAKRQPHHGIVILVGRKTRAAEQRRCFVYWSAPAHPASRTTSTLREQDEWDRRILKQKSAGGRERASEKPVAPENSESVSSVRSVFVFGQHEPETIAQLEDVASRAERAALMADGHLGYVMPIGGVAAYKEKVSVVGVGFDIACGNAAIRTDLKYTPALGQQLPALADEIQNAVSFGMGRRNLADDAPVDHPLFKSPSWDAVPAAGRDGLRSKARAQLGTVGSGNHYVDVFADEHNDIWVGVHFGSRGFGHTVASGFLSLSQGGKWGGRAPEREVPLPLDMPMGQDYWALMSLAGEYAYAGREWVARKVVSILGGTEQELVHNHHNFAWREEHDGRSLIVVRKGATPAFPGQKGFIGGSMGDDAVIVQGVTEADEETRELLRRAMYSTVHGAGRVMSRTEAAGKRNWKTGKILKPGAVSPQMMHDWVRGRGVILRGGGLDESPHAYRRLPDVLTAQKGTIEILHTLRPLIVVMAGADVFDPYKD